MKLRFRAALLSAIIAASCDGGDSPTTPSDPVRVEIQSLPEAIEGRGYSQQLRAAGGRGGYSWVLAAGSLPAGLTLAPTGAISGTPIGGVTANFRVRATDSSGQSATADLSIVVVQALAIHTLTLPNGVVDQAYVAQLEAVGGKGSYSWRVAGGGAAAWLTVSPSGVLSGTPVTSGATSLRVELANPSGQVVTREFSIFIFDALVVVEINLPAAVQGRVFAAQLVATGGDGTYSWSLHSGALPSGIGLQSGGALTGTPSDAGTFAFTVEVMDGLERTATRSLSLTVERAVTIGTQSLPPANLGAAYSAQLVATGGSGSYTWSLAGGVLPSGLTLSAAGAITGTPTVQGSSDFTVRVADEASTTDTRAFTMVVGSIAGLASGVAVTDIAGDAGSERYYSISVPSGATQLTVVMTGGTGDADLYIRRGELPQQFAYDCRPLRQGNEETCAVSSPTAGQWYVMVRGFAAYTGVELTATVVQ